MKPPPKKGLRKGGVGGIAPHLRREDWGAKPPSLEITHFVTFSVMFFVVFVEFHPLFTPPKTSFFPTDPSSLLAGYQGFYSDFREISKEICGILGIFSRILGEFYPTQKPPFSQQIPLACWLLIRGFIVILGKYLRKFVEF